MAEMSIEEILGELGAMEEAPMSVDEVQVVEEEPVVEDELMDIVELFQTEEFVGAVKMAVREVLEEMFPADEVEEAPVEEVPVDVI